MINFIIRTYHNRAVDSSTGHGSSKPLVRFRIHLLSLVVGVVAWGILKNAELVFYFIKIYIKAIYNFSVNITFKKNRVSI